MADDEKNKKSTGPSEERFKYIGFDVFPGKAGNMFKSDEERKTWVEKVRAKLSRSQGEVRDRCTLMETRVSSVEKIFLTLAAVVMLAGLFIPWFSGYIPVSYSELGSFGDYSFFYASRVDERGIRDLSNALITKQEKRYAADRAAENAAPVPPLTNDAVPIDSATVAEQVATADTVVKTNEEEAAQGQMPQESAGGGEPERVPVPEAINVIFVNTPDIDQIHGVDDLRKHVVAAFSYNARTKREDLVHGSDGVMGILPDQMLLKARSDDSIATAVTDSMRAAAAKRIAAGDSTISLDSIAFAGPILVSDKAVPELALKGIVNDNYSVTGIGALLSFGAYSSRIFSSGLVLVISGIFLIVYFLSCVVIAILDLYLLYGGGKKGTPEAQILYLKRMLRYNWVPVILWLGMFVLSFFGASYGFDPSGLLQQVGDSYGIGTFIGLSSFGMYITLGAFLIVALKGKEI